MGLDSGAMTTGVLLRTAARLARVPAAVLDIDREFAARSVFGLSDSAAGDVLSARRTGRPLPGGRSIVLELPVPMPADPSRIARLLLVGDAPLQLDEAHSRALRVIASEIGHELEVGSVEDRRGLREQFGDRIESVAVTADASSDPAAIFEAPRAGNVPLFLYVNAAFERFFGYSLLDVIGQTPEFYHGPITDLARVDFVHDRARLGNNARTEVVLYKRDGIPVWAELNLRPILESNGAVSFYLATYRDVTARKEFEAAVATEKRKLQVTLAAIVDGVITTVVDGRVDFVNAAARAMLEVESADAYGESLSTVLKLHDGESPIDVIAAAKSQGGVARGEGLMTFGSHVRSIAYVTSAIGDAPDGYVVVIRDITEQKQLAVQLSYEASHDQLTGLYNRRKFEDVLAGTLANARRENAHHTLAFCDLDHFKVINDRCGHAGGDRVLTEIGQVLLHNLRDRDVLARLGGDEFAVVLQNCTLANARKVLDKLRRAVLGYSIECDGSRYSVGVSIGLAPIDATTRDASAVLGVADAACYAAKAAGRNVIVG